MSKLIRFTFASLAVLAGSVAFGCVGEPVDSEPEPSEGAEEIGEAAQEVMDPYQCSLRNPDGTPHAAWYPVYSDSTCISNCQWSHPNVGDYCTRGDTTLVGNYFACRVRDYAGNLLGESPDAHAGDGASCRAFCDGYAQWGATCRLGGGVLYSYGTCRLVRGQTVKKANPVNSVPFNDPGCLSWCNNNVPFNDSTGYQCVRDTPNTVLATYGAGGWPQ